MPLNVGLSSCGSLCQHPGCWTTVRKQQKGIAKSLPPLDSSSSDDSDSDLDLPTQAVCNLLADFGESPEDRYPVSTGGRPSHHWESPIHSAGVKSKETPVSPKKLYAPNNTKASLLSKAKSTCIPSQRPCITPQRPRMPLVEVQEVFDCADLNSQWDEAFVTKQYYIWVANPHGKRKKKKRSSVTGHSGQNLQVLMKDMTEVMVPAEIEQQREDTILFDEWPVLKKKQPRTASPPAKSLQFKKALPPPAATLPEPSSNVDMDGINELLALPKDVLVKVLEQTKKSDFTSKGKLHSIVQACAQDNEAARMMLNTRELLKQKKMNIHTEPRMTQSHHTFPQPVFQLDDETVIDRMSSANTPVRDKAMTDQSSVESFPRYTKPLPKITANSQSTYQLVRPGKLIEAPESARGPVFKAKLPSISLGLPELPSGVRTTKAFVYDSKNSMDFTLGPVISPPSTHRSSTSGGYSDHGTTVKVNPPMSGVAFYDLMGKEYDMGIHSVSPALSTHVPLAPAGTPATFMTPTKSAPNLREITKEPTQITFNLSIRAQPSSRDLRDSTFLTSPASNIDGQPLPIPASPVAVADCQIDGGEEDKALDTIKETAREIDVDGSVVASSHGTAGEPPRLILQPSNMTNINTMTSPAPPSARSVESCPSPEQWPLISEVSFERMMPRPSISEPALSGRSARRHRGHAESPKSGDRDYARRVMDEKNKAESPAPPPPSPEPKDTADYRSRKDLKSRESLSMAPLFEVNEIEESDRDEGKLTDRDEKRKPVRKIHAVIPHGSTEDVKAVDKDESQEVMISQITVTHVAPKGTGDPTTGKDNNREKVQETFLNVDIPAEEISSCKAEQGSSHQEEISSTNGSVVKSEMTATESQESARAAEAGESEDKAEKEVQGEEDIVRDKDASPEREEVAELGQTYRQTSMEEQNYLDMQSDNLNTERTDFLRLNSEDSGVSPELVCDSARFMSHDLVSPMEDEMGGQTRLLSFLQEVERAEEDDQEGMDLNERVIVGDGEENKEAESTGGFNTVAEDDKDKVVDSGENYAIRDGEDQETGSGSKTTEHSEEIEPPGSFFFQNNGDLTGKDEENDKNLNSKEKEVYTEGAITETDAIAAVINQTETGQQENQLMNTQETDSALDGTEVTLEHVDNNKQDKTEMNADIDNAKAADIDTKEVVGDLKENNLDENKELEINNLNNVESNDSREENKGVTEVCEQDIKVDSDAGEVSSETDVKNDPEMGAGIDNVENRSDEMKLDLNTQEEEDGEDLNVDETQT